MGFPGDSTFPKGKQFSVTMMDGPAQSMIVLQIEVYYLRRLVNWAETLGF